MSSFTNFRFVLQTFNPSVAISISSEHVHLAPFYTHEHSLIISDRRKAIKACLQSSQKELMELYAHTEEHCTFNPEYLRFEEDVYADGNGKLVFVIAHECVSDIGPIRERVLEFVFDISTQELGVRLSEGGKYGVKNCSCLYPPYMYFHYPINAESVQHFIDQMEGRL